MSDPSLHVINVAPGNAAGLTPGTYVRLLDLVAWLNFRRKPNIAKAISEQALTGDTSNVKYAQIGNGGKLRKVGRGA